MHAAARAAATASRAPTSSSLFPFGFFRKGVRYRVDLEVLVFPEIFPPPAARREDESGQHRATTPAAAPAGGTTSTALRRFRHGDDPRGIHWKQTARTGAMVYMEREAERQPAAVDPVRQRRRRARGRGGRSGASSGW